MRTQRYALYGGIHFISLSTLIIYLLALVICELQSNPYPRFLIILSMTQS